MKALVQQLGYALDPNHDIWLHPDYQGLAYNDGDEVETRIASAIAQSTDLGILSNSFHNDCIDWPSLYHLSSVRANLMRPFEHLLQGDILEVGSGCGAITRYLGECGANVLALEGSHRRAAITRSRTRDLANVTVLAEAFDRFHSQRQFDVITLIGVLEYANVFWTADNPPLAMLQHARSLLKPHGKLIIAIENQLGLKYFAGAPEDHLGIAMVGIEGRYQRHQPQTFGRHVLTDMLQQAEFAHCEFLAPFPDYKLPISIVTRAGFAHPQFDAAAFAWQSARRDPQLPFYGNFSVELAWPEIINNKLGLDLSNSFLIIASPQATPLLAPNVLAHHYTVSRKAEYCKASSFISREDTPIEVQCRQLGDATGIANALLSFHLSPSESYTPGTSLALEFINLVSQDHWTFSQVAHFIQRYIEILRRLEPTAVSLDFTQPYSELPGCFFDAIPNNIIIQADQTPTFIDQEWQLNGTVELAHLLFRSLLSLLNTITRLGRPSPYVHLTRHQFIDQALSAAGLAIQAKDYHRYIALEADVQASITGRDSTMFLEWGQDWPLPTLNLQQTLHERDATIAQLQQALSDCHKKIETLTENTPPIPPPSQPSASSDTPTRERTWFAKIFQR